MNIASPIIESDNFTLRPFQYTDAEALARHANDPEVARYLRTTFPHPYFVYDAQRFIDWVNQQDDQYVLAIEVGGEAAGAIGIHRTYFVRKPVWEVGYWLGRQHWNKNITTRALTYTMNYFVPLLKIEELYARIYDPNVASAKVLQKCGFTLLSSLKGVILRDDSQVNEQIWIKKF